MQESSAGGKPLTLIFGYGSIINHKSRASTLDVESSECLLVRVAATAGWTRCWNFRSPTGFTALGLRRAGGSKGQGSSINGVVFPVTRLCEFDMREAGYQRVRVNLEHIDMLGKGLGSNKNSKCSQGANESDGVDSKALSQMPRWASVLTSSIDRARSGDGETKSTQKCDVWTYIPSSPSNPSADFPICQSYVDTVLGGCFQEGGKAFASEFISSTSGWCAFFLNDIPLSRRPWLHRGKQYGAIDALLTAHGARTHIADRRHPEEFAAQFLGGLRGMWGVPARNGLFMSRQAELGRLSAMLRSRSRARAAVVGLGGVGKTQIAIEFAHRHYAGESEPRTGGLGPDRSTSSSAASAVEESVSYGLVVWVNAETREALINDLSSAALDFGMDVKGKTNLQVSETFKAALCQARHAWLLVFDNAERPEIIEDFIPRGGRTGHVVLTSRILPLQKDMCIVVDCFSERDAVAFLARAAGPNAGIAEKLKNKDGSERKETAGSALARRLGGLPLALAMAAAYMQRADITCWDYTAKFDARALGLENKMSRVAGYGTGVQGSLSLSLRRLAAEGSGEARRVLEALSHMAPDGITRPLLHAVLRAQREAAVAKLRRIGSTRYRVSIRGILAAAAAGAIAWWVGRSAKLGSNRRLPLAAGCATVVGLVSLRNPVSSARGTAAGESTASAKSGPVEDASLDAASDAVWTTLKTYSLLSVRGRRAASMHRLLQQVLRSERSPSERASVLAQCVSALSFLWSFDVDDAETWQGAGVLLEHVKAVSAHARAMGSGAISPQCRAALAGLLCRSARYLTMAFNRFDEAQELITWALAWRRQATAERDVSRDREALAAALRLSGQVLRYRRRFGEARKALDEALDMQRRERASVDDAEGRASTHTSLDFELSLTLHELGVLNVKEQKADVARTCLERSLTLKRRLLLALRSRSGQERGGEALHKRIQRETAATLHQLAMVATMSRPPRHGEAEAMLQESLRLETEQKGYTATVRSAATLTQLGRVALRLNRARDAEAHLKKALAILTETYKSELHVTVASVRHQMALVLTTLGRLDAAAYHMQQALRIRQKLAQGGAAGRGEVARTLHDMGLLERRRQDWACAEAYFVEERTELEAIFAAGENVDPTLRSRALRALLACLHALRAVHKRQDGKESELEAVAKQLQTVRARIAAAGAKDGDNVDEARSAKRSSPLLARALEMRSRLRASIKASRAKDRRKDPFGWVQVELKTTRAAVAGADPGAKEVTKAVVQFLDAVEAAIPSVAGAKGPTKAGLGALFSACDALRDSARKCGVAVNDKRI